MMIIMTLPLALTYDIVWASWGALGMKNLPPNAGDVRDVDSIPGSGIPGGGTTPVFFPGAFHGQRSLVGYMGVTRSPTGLK